MRDLRLPKYQENIVLGEERYGNLMRRIKLSRCITWETIPALWLNQIILVLEMMQQNTLPLT